MIPTRKSVAVSWLMVFLASTKQKKSRSPLEFPSVLVVDEAELGCSR